MKKSELIQIFREYLNDDLRKIIKEELNGLLNEGLQSNIPLQTKPIQQNKPEIKFKGNGILTNILNETAQNYQPDIDENDTTLDFSKMDSRVDIRSQIRNRMGMEISGINTGPISAMEMIPENRQHVPIPDEIKNVLTRDYSTLVKTFKK